jgi:hypothetical protein
MMATQACKEDNGISPWRMEPNSSPRNNLNMKLFHHIVICSHNTDGITETSADEHAVLRRSKP